MDLSCSRRCLIAGLAGLPLAAIVGACSGVDAVNALVPREGYERIDGLAYGPDERQRLDLYRPTGKGPFPVVVFFYGGGWDSGERADYLFIGQRLASAGYLAVIPDYRLFPDVAFPGFIDDCAEAVAWTGLQAAAYGGDPGRIALMGHSAGAYNAMMLGLDQRYLIAAGWPASRLSGVIGLAGPYDFRPFDSTLLQGVFGTWPDSDATQPITFARADAPPLLLATGTDDTTVLPANSERLARAIEGAGGEVTLVRYPGMGHVGIVAAIAQPVPGSDAVFGDIRAFLARQGMAGRAAPA